MFSEEEIAEILEKLTNFRDLIIKLNRDYNLGVISCISTIFLSTAFAMVYLWASRKPKPPKSQQESASHKKTKTRKSQQTAQLKSKPTLTIKSTERRPKVARTNLEIKKPRDDELKVLFISKANTEDPVDSWTEVKPKRRSSEKSTAKLVRKKSEKQVKKVNEASPERDRTHVPLIAKVEVEEVKSKLESPCKSDDVSKTTVSDDPIEKNVSDDPIEKNVSEGPTKTNVSDDPIEKNVSEGPTKTNVSEGHTKTNVSDDPIEKNVSGDLIETDVTDNTKEDVEKESTESPVLQLTPTSSDDFELIGMISESSNDDQELSANISSTSGASRKKNKRQQKLVAAQLKEAADITETSAVCEDKSSAGPQFKLVSGKRKKRSRKDD